MSTPGAKGGYQLGGPKLSPHVKRQLQSRRRRFGDAWRRDPMREGALAVLFLLSLAAITVLSVGAKQRFFDLSGVEGDDFFWMESAQRYRYVEMVAEGGFIPPIDRRMQAPDGYVPWSDTVLQEIAYGTAYRRLAGPEIGLAPFVRLTTRLVSASAVFPVILLCFAITRRRDAALLGGLMWAVALPVAERGTGTVLFREDLAVPILLWHLAALGFWVRRPRIPAALLSGILLALALLLWKVVTFYFLMLVAFLATAHWLGRAEPRHLLAGTVALFLPAFGASYLPFNLRHDGFLTSTAMLCAGAVMVAMVADIIDGALASRAGREPRKRVVWVGVAAGVFLVARLLLPGEAGYDHAWETIAAKVRYLGVKPDAPSALSFHARHYWTGNYESPSLRLLARNWPWMVLAALPGLVMAARWWRPKFQRTFRVEDRLPEPPPTRLLQGFGPTEPLRGLASHYVLWLTLSFVGVYLLFRKFQLLAAIPLVLLTALGFASFERRRRTVRAVLCAVVLVVLAQGRGLVPDVGVVLDLPPREEPGEWDPVIAYTPSSFDGLARELPGRVEEDEPVLASFVISPFILAYLDRPTVLHCFFEGDVLERYRAVTEARFGDEEALWQVASSYGAKWYVHEAHHLLRDDRRLSQRYVAAAGDWPHDSVLVRMQYAPEQLKRFELAWQNDWFRLFRVLDEDESPARPRGDTSRPIWNRRLFEALFGDPLSPVDEAAAFPLEPSDLLFTTLSAQRSMSRARFDPAKGRVGTPYTERQLQEAVRIAPYLYEADEMLAAYYQARERWDRAAEHRAAALSTKAAMTGRKAISDSLRPIPIPVRGDR